MEFAGHAEGDDSSVKSRILTSPRGVRLPLGQMREMSGPSGKVSDRAEALLVPHVNPVYRHLSGNDVNPCLFSKLARGGKRSATFQIQHATASILWSPCRPCTRHF
ncbi:MAG: hypothetical protein Ct9H300mP28_22720 [Pseudomonadota bacterium]|nr:MAG: hypothetical protein Ct9H300mP28_22720 [Pseudomonadota bacterium]